MLLLYPERKWHRLCSETFLLSKGPVLAGSSVGKGRLQQSKRPRSQRFLLLFPYSLKILLRKSPRLDLDRKTKMILYDNPVGKSRLSLDQAPACMRD
jgi:hypothetical protein